MRKSKSQINANIKELEQSIRKIKLTATLAKGNTKSELNQVIRQLESQLKQIKVQAKIDNRQLNREINSALRNVSARDIQLNINSNGERLNAQLRRTVSQARDFVNRNPISLNIDLKREKLLNQLTAFTNKHTKINESSYWLGEAERLRGVISSVTNRDELRNATDQLQVFTSGVRATGYAAVSTTDKIKGMLGNIVKVGNYFGLAFVAVNKFRQSLNTLKTNDTILTEISKTSEMTKQQLKELGDEAFNVASKYGQVSGNYLTAVQEMARSGYEMISNELGELSLLAQSAGDMTAEMANNYILATDAAYKYGGSVEKLNAALDGANYISNKNSASLTDIADATRVSASFAANAGVAIDELTAAEATMIATTKRSGSEMGRAFRSILLNLQQVSGEFDSEEINEEQLKKVEERCHSLGVELEYMKDGVATLRNPMEILKELSEVFNSLPDNSADKQGLISDLGGKYHANALSALLSRWDLYEKMVGEFSQGTGSALEEANKTADSWAGRLAQLQNSWDSFVNSLTNKGAIKGGVSFLDNTIQGFEKLTDTLGAIPVLLTTINGSMSALNKNYGITQIFNKDTRRIDLQGNFMGIDITAYKTQAKHFREAEIAMRIWNERMVDGTADINTFGGAIVQNNAHLKAYLQTTSTEAPASLAGYRAYLNAAGVSTDALRLKTILMTSALTFGLTFAIQGAVTIISKLANAQKEAVRSAQEAADAYSDSSSSVNDYISRYKELQEALTAAKGNEEETYNVKKQLLDLQNELNEKYGDEYGKLNLVTDAYKDQTAAIQAYNKEAANTFLNENMDGIKSAINQMEKERRYLLSYSESSSTDRGKALKEIAEKYKDKGVTLLDETGGGSYEQFSVHLNTDAQSAYETINAFENDLRQKANELGDAHLFDGLFDISSGELNKAKETIDKYSDIYKQALSAEIASDDGKSKKYNEALQAVEAYNEAVLKSNDIYSDKNVEEARQSLQGIKEELSGEEWEKYGALIDDVFSQADTRLLDFNEHIKNDDSVKGLAEELKGLDDIDLQAFNEAVGTNNSFDKLKESAESYGLGVDELIDTLVRLGYVQTQVSEGTEDIALSFKDKFQNLWDSSTFEDAKKDLAKLAKEAGITEKDIQSLASENSELASLLNESGMSAQFAATCFNKMSNGADGFSSITEDALALDKVLHGMDESLQNVAASKSTYDKALEQDDYDTEFENYQEAYKNAMQMFEDGDYGRHFRSSMEYFLGEDSYTMSIEELYSAMNNLKSVFGENATNGLEFVDKLYAKKDILDGMDSSLEKLSDGTYNVDLDPDEFEKIGEALGMTAEEVAACTNALGMFGNFHFYDLEEVEKTLNGISIAAKNGEQSILSMQGVEKILADIGYNGYDVYHIMQNIARMGSIQLLDFGAEDTESIQAVINKLKELDMIEISGNSINVSGLIDSLHESLGMAADDINAFLENINGQFKFADAEGSLISLDQAKNMVLQAEDTSAAEGIDKIGEAAETTDGKVNTLHDDTTALNTVSLSGLNTEFNTVGFAVDNLNQKVKDLSGQIDAVNNKTVSAPNVPTGTMPSTNMSPTKPDTKKASALGNAQIGHAFSSGTIGAPKTETALINELGNETIIDPEKGTYEVVGGGAQFRKIKKGQIILNHLQTKALQKFGKISSFGKMLFGGNANMKGSSYVGGIVGGTNPATGKSYQNSSNSNTVKKATE
ncbi:MAG: phage tail tape measure protein, partial [Eubacterium sp.]|nr:phage tail tape measure protein [Eubacterium sp.]